MQICTLTKNLFQDKQFFLVSACSRTSQDEALAFVLQKKLLQKVDLLLSVSC